MSNRGSSSEVDRLIAVKCEVLCSVCQTNRVYDSLVVPKHFGTKIPPNTKTLVLRDSYNREFQVCFGKSLEGKFKIFDKEWPDFVYINLVGEIRIFTLCLRILNDNVVEVFCFNELGEEFIRRNDGHVLLKRCLIAATEHTVHEQLFNERLLEDLNVNYKRETTTLAEVTGPRHDSHVQVLFKSNEDNSSSERWVAYGFYGAKWTLFVLENFIEPNRTFMVTNMRNGCFKVSVFSPKGIAISSHSFDADNRMNYLDDSCDFSDDTSLPVTHQCRVLGHQHLFPYCVFTIKLPELIVTRKFLTIPTEFVEQHHLYLHDKAFMFYGILKFRALLQRRFDGRRPSHLSHMVIKGNWSRFLNDTGLLVGDNLRFEFNPLKSIINGPVVFTLC